MQERINFKTNVQEIINSIYDLPVSQRMFIVEKVVQSVRYSEKTDMQKAVDLLYDDYKNDKELTVFTQLDQENFYEAR
jgi:hypothetical protein